MNSLVKNRIAHLTHVYKHFKRQISQKQFQVTPFCQINVEGTFNININPLDIFNYKDCDKVIIEGPNSITQDGDVITITSENDQLHECKIIAPVKANFSIKNAHNVSMRNFHCNKININAKRNIEIEKCYAETIELFSLDGNITAKNVIQAANILLLCENGNIQTGKLQGINLQVQTKTGNIHIDSTYCDRSKIQTCKGDVLLNNAHKNVNVSIQEEGNLNIVGLDGSLDAHVNAGNVSLQIARILANSRLRLVNNGDVLLKLAEECQEQATFVILGKNCIPSDNLNMTLSKLGNKFYLNSKQNVENTKEFLVDCLGSNVNVSTMNWSEMFISQFHKN